MKRNLLLTILSLFAVSLAFGQTTVSGVVTSVEDGEGVPGVSVVVKNTIVGVTTDLDGNYTIDVPADRNILIFSYIGMQSQELEVNGQTTINVALESAVLGLDEVIVTAIGIEREKKALGYSTQEVGGEEVSTVKNSNFINSLSGKVSGVNIRKSNQLGGSANIVIRGYKSLTGNNQPLFVIDGVPISNQITNNSSETTGRGGYDFGNAAMDVNPEDVKDISILKGAAATALYGARAANGVVMITTKRGTRGKGLGVTFNTSYTMGNVDKSTLPVYQNEYGAGYGAFYGSPDGYFDLYDVDGDGTEDLVVPMYEDASFGGAFDPNLMVYGWESIYPELSTYGQKQAWVAAENDPNTFWETMSTFNNSIAIDGGTDRSAFRLSYTNFDQSGIVPNSRIKRNTINFSGSQDLNERLTISSVVTYTNSQGKGRYGTGYDSRNVNQSFRQWYEVNVDMQRLKEVYDETGKNITWNAKGYGAANPTQPNYFDNPYYAAYENYETDERNRVFGNMELKYELSSWLDFLARFSLDNYSMVQEERISVGSVDVPWYGRTNWDFMETNTDLLLNANKYFGADDIFNFSGTLGVNFRRTSNERWHGETNGGLIIPGVYSLTNSVNSILQSNAQPVVDNNRRLLPTETASTVGVNGYYVRASLGYDRFLYLDLTGRYDVSSTLPEDNNAYFYPSASLSFVFSELMDVDALDFAKFRINYATVGASAPAQSIFDTYVLNPAFEGIALASVPSTKNNAELKPERTRSIEAGLEFNLWRNRLGLDLSYFISNSFDQILPVSVTSATGHTFQYVNAGNIENKGLELSITGTPVRTENFSWDIRLNWTKSKNEVVELFEDQTNLMLTPGSNQGGVSINATVGEPYGAIWGTNFIYAENGEKVVYDHPFGGVRYAKTVSPEVIGNIQPDWQAGIQNILHYKDFSLSFLIDIQKGGDFFSLDTWYGYATGLYDFTAGTNDKGNPVRMNPDDGGGKPIGGVLAATDPVTGAYLRDEDGNLVAGTEANTEYAYAEDVYSSFAYAIAPNAMHVYDASYIKLRELALTYKLPKSMFTNSVFQGISLTLVGNNLWIIDKNSPYSDPEAGLSAGNFQGYQSGAYASVKEIGLNLRATF